MSQYAVSVSNDASKLVQVTFLPSFSKKYYFETAIEINWQINNEKRKPCLFPASKYLESISINSFGHLPKKTNGNQSIVVHIPHYSILTEVVPSANTFSSAMTATSVAHLVSTFGISHMLLIENGLQFTSRYFIAVWNVLSVESLGITEQFSRTNAHVERFNCTLPSRLPHYAAGRRSDWGTFVFPLTYAYNLRIHCYIKFSPFTLVLSKQPPEMGAVRSTFPHLDIKDKA